MTNVTAARVTFQNLSDSALQAQIELKAAPDRVYAAWTKPEVLPQWLCPSKSGSLQVDHFDCTVGGRYDVTMVFSDGDRVQIVGTFQELDAPKKIVLTWQWMEGAALSNKTLVTVDLVPSQAGTHLTLTHERFLSAEAREQHQQGWEPILVRLASVLEI